MALHDGSPPVPMCRSRERAIGNLPRCAPACISVPAGSKGISGEVVAEKQFSALGKLQSSDYAPGPRDLREQRGGMLEVLVEVPVVGQRFPQPAGLLQHL